MTDEPLAIEGGLPALAEGPPGWPRPDERIRAALLAAYETGDWGKYHAGHVEQLEHRLAALHGAGQALACASGTFAVELALRALKVAAGDEVILAGYDFPGNFRAIEAIGARPVLVDIEPGTWCLDVEQCASAISPQTKAVVVSHLHGGIADMRALRALCDAQGVAIVEDACQTPGGTVQGRVAGAWGDVGVLSFGGSKLLTSGRGGAIVTNDAQIAQRAKVFCERGNHAFPLSELQAAVLLPQLETLAADNAVRQTRVEQLLAATQDIECLAPLVMNPDRGLSSYYKLGWLYAPRTGEETRERFTQAMRAEGVALDTAFRGFAGRTAARCRPVGELTHARTAAQSTVILHHPVLLQPPETIARVAHALRKVARAR